MQLSNGPFPRRVLCTGAGGGGAYATLCAVWAAVTFPLAQVRHITFGAPAVSTLSRLVYATVTCLCTLETVHNVQHRSLTWYVNA